jgi:2-methylcitrate dehydratase
MLAVALLYGDVTSDSYSDAFAAADPRIDQLRDKMQIIEDINYSLDYLDSHKRAIPNAVQVFFKDGSNTPKIEVLYPLGHKLRRNDAMPFLKDKYQNAIQKSFSSEPSHKLLELWDLSVADLSKLPASQFVELWLK